MQERGPNLPEGWGGAPTGTRALTLKRTCSPITSSVDHPMRSALQFPHGGLTPAVCLMGCELSVVTKWRSLLSASGADKGLLEWAPLPWAAGADRGAGSQRVVVLPPQPVLQPCCSGNCLVCAKHWGPPTLTRSWRLLG